jgi:hypothetical protein
MASGIYVTASSGYCRNQNIVLVVETQGNRQEKIQIQKVTVYRYQNDCRIRKTAKIHPGSGEKIFDIEEILIKVS